MITHIEKIVCKGEKVCIEAIHTKSRKRELVLARQIIMYFTRKTDKSMLWSKIGAYFNRDHATAIHAHKTILSLIVTDRKFKTLMRQYEIKLTGNLSPELYDADAIVTLSNEILLIEKTISEMNDRARLIRTEISCISIHRAKLLRDELKLLSAKKIEVKEPEIKPIERKSFTEQPRKEQNINPQAGAYHGYYQHAF